MRDDGPDSLVADLVTILVGPILIMAMVGSLAFFLLELFYSGAYAGRLHFIMALFTLAIVLVGRISMTEGYEKAMMYAAALAVVTCLAVMRFVDNAPLACMGIILVMWWFAHKLTWDCTVDDLSQDTTDVGLLEKAGLDPEASAGRDEKNAAAKSRPDEAPKDKDGTSSGDSVETGFWRSLVLRDKRFHAPGVWIVYFSLAALPLFGLGQLMIPAADTESRRWAFVYLLIYTAAGLGLLMTTSFLSLRRYLHKRRARMPLGVAATWCIAGPIVILLILGVALLLPRPGVNDELSQLPISVELTSPELEESSVQVGDDGADKNREDADSEARGERPSDETPQDEGREGRAPSEDDSSNASPNGETDEGQGSPSQDESEGESGTEPSGDQGESNAENGSDSEDSKDSPSRNEGQNKNGSENGDENGGDPGEDPGNEEREGADAQDDPRDGSDPQEQDDGKEQDNGRNEQPSSSGGGGRSEEGERTTDQEEQAESDGEQGGATETDSAEQQSWRMPEVSFSFSGNWLIGILKLVLYAVLAVAFVYFLYRHGRALLEGLREFGRSLRDFWARLFGKKAGTADDAADADDDAPRVPTHAPFSAYDDPFRNGDVSRMRPDAIASYTFAALEAWSREHGVPRNADRTPHEFARIIGDNFPTMEQDARLLAFLYVQAAYSPETVPPKRIAELRKLWRLMDRLKRPAL